MEKFNKKGLLELLLFITVIAFVSSCKKEQSIYRHAVPAHEVSTSTYDFLKTQNGLYDTLLYLIDKVGLRDTLTNAQVTFFAPQDYSINTAMHNLNIARRQNGDNGNWTIDSVRTGTWDTLLHRYLLGGIVDLDSLDYADGVNLITPYGYEMNGKTITLSASGIKNGGSKEIEYSDKNRSRFTKDWVSAFTRTVNLKTKNGLLHVLNTNHVFGFSAFVDSVYPTVRGPYLGEYQVVPGTIEMGYYDEGGEGIAYHDADAANRGKVTFRTGEGVDLDNCKEGLYNIGYSAPGEWLMYSVKVEKTQSYVLKIRVGTPHADGSVHIEMDGTNISGSVKVPKTGGYQTWETVVADHPVFIKEGIHTFRFYLEAGAYNVSRFGFTPTERQPYPKEMLQIPGTIHGYEYDYGGEGVAYHDNEEDNRGNARTDVRFFGGVDIENCIEGGYDVGYLSTGEWIAYTVNIQKAGKYKVTSRVASPHAYGRFHIELDGEDITGSMSVPDKGGYQNWTDVETTVTLPAGQHEIKMCIDKSGFNWQKFEFTAL